MPLVTGYNYDVYGGIPAGIENVSLSDDTSYNGVKAFMVDADGTIALEMHDNSTGTMVVKSGAQYAANVTKFKSTGSSGITTVTILY